MLDLLPSAEPTTSPEYCTLLSEAIWKHFTVGRDMAIGGGIAASGIGLQAYWGLISIADWHDHKSHWILSVVLPFAAVFAGHLMWRALTSPYKVHKGRERFYETELVPLRAFKKEVEDKEVTLLVARCETKQGSMETIVQIRNQIGPAYVVETEKAEYAYVVFSNPRKPGMPGKEAKSVLARIKYSGTGGNHFEFEQDARWAETTQPGALRPGESKVHILRIDFEAGAEHYLDIASKLNDGCYAANNDGIRRTDNKLYGDVVKVTVHLVAQNVDQTLHFELKNPCGAMKVSQV